MRSSYDTTFNAEGLLVLPRGEDEGMIFVCVKNRRSPFSLVRLDTEFNILGRYWHFGHLEGPALVTFNVEGGKRLILWGTNDFAEGQGLSHSVLVVLDPAKIRGTTESSATRGFGYVRAGGEQWYLRFPDPDIAAPLSATGALSRLESITDDAIRVVQHFQGGAGVEFGLEYVLGKDMVVKQVKAVSGYEICHGNLVRSGEIRSVLDDSYFDALRRGVRYWDGERWVQNVVMAKR
jgi:hypothetical protein